MELADSHFRHIIFYHLQVREAEMLRNQFSELCEKNKQYDQGIRGFQSTLDGGNKRRPPSQRQSLSEAYLESQLMHANQRVEALHAFNLELEKREEQLQRYLNLIIRHNGANPQDATALLNEVKEREKAAWDSAISAKRIGSDNSAIIQEYIEEFSKRLTDRKFKYSDPRENSLFIQIMAHPMSQKLAALVLVGGLTCLALGTVSLSIALPVVTIAAAVSMIVIGSATTLAASGTLVCRFFREPSPFEVDANKPLSSLPDPVEDDNQEIVQQSEQNIPEAEVAAPALGS